MTSMQKAMDFVVWANALRMFPRYEQVMERFSVSYATAQRWLTDYADARKTLRPYRKTGRRRAA